MRTIIRCPSCFTYVYSDARLCHGCGVRMGKRRWLTRGSWIFVTLAVAGFTLARGIDLHQEKRDRTRRQVETALDVEKTTSFVKSWLTASPEEVGTHFSDPRTFGPLLVKLREKFPGVLPATDVTSVRVNSERWQSHIQAARGPVAHRNDDWPDKLRVSAPQEPSSTFSDIRGRITHRSWTSDAYGFEAEFQKGDRSYTVYGQVCIEDQTIHCLALDRIESIEGVVRPTE